MRKPIQAAFFDIDGTIVSFKTHRMPDQTRAALLAMHAAGIRLALATGRMRHGLPTAVEGIPWDAYVLGNGQMTYAGDTLLRRHTFTQADMDALAALLGELDAPCLILEEDRSFMTGMNEQARTHFAMMGMTPPPVLGIAPVGKRPVYQMVIYTDARGERRALDAMRDIEPIRAARMCLDIIPAGGGKPEGMAAVLAHFGLTREACIAFGDGRNDTTMLRYAGIGVAMGGAPEEVCAAADFVTTSVDEDGVGRAARHFGLIAP